MAKSMMWCGRVRAFTFSFLFAGLAVTMLAVIPFAPESHSADVQALAGFLAAVFGMTAVSLALKKRQPECSP